MGRKEGEVLKTGAEKVASLHQDLDVRSQGYEQEKQRAYALLAKLKSLGLEPGDTAPDLG